MNILIHSSITKKTKTFLDKIHKIKHELRNRGLFLRKIPFGPNAFYSAISDQINGDTYNQNRLRKMACDYISNHRSDFENEKPSQTPWNEFIRNMRHATNGGYEIACKALAARLKRTIKIIFLEIEDKIFNPPNSKGETAHPIRVLAHFVGSMIHFSSIVQHWDSPEYKQDTLKKKRKLIRRLNKKHKKPAAKKIYVPKKNDDKTIRREGEMMCEPQPSSVSLQLLKSLAQPPTCSKPCKLKN